MNVSLTYATILLSILILVKLREIGVSLEAIDQRRAYHQQKGDRLSGMLFKYPHIAAHHRVHSNLIG